MRIKAEYRPHPKQRSFHKSKSKFRLLSTGVGFGKTAAGVTELLKQALKSKPCIYVMVAPTYKMLTQVTIREFLKFCPRELIKDYNRGRQVITLINDVEILGIAGDREDTIDRIRGLSIGGGYGDEIALCPEYMHEILIARLRDANGCLRIWYTTTPKGFNWLHRIFVKKEDKKGNLYKNPEDYEIFTGSTMDNPHTPEEYKSTMLNTYVGVFKSQEIYGQFVGFESCVYQSFRRDLHVVDIGKMREEWNEKYNIEEGEEKEEMFKSFVCGVDFGFTNPSVILKIGFDHDGRAYITKEFYQTKVTDKELAQIAADEFGEDVNYIADSANPGGIEEFKRVGLSCKGAKKFKGEGEEGYVMSGIKYISSLLEPQEDKKPRLYIDKSCVNTIMEFENYRYPDSKDERPLQERPLKVYDHAMDALRYALVKRVKELVFAFA